MKKNKKESAHNPKTAKGSKRLYEVSVGEFAGIVADSPDQKIPQKMFHAEIQNDHQGIAREEAAYRPLPVIQQVSDLDVQENYFRVKNEVMDLLKLELSRIKDRRGVKGKKFFDVFNFFEKLADNLRKFFKAKRFHSAFYIANFLHYFFQVFQLLEKLDLALCIVLGSFSNTSLRAR